MCVLTFSSHGRSHGDTTGAQTHRHTQLQAQTLARHARRQTWSFTPHRLSHRDTQHGDRTLSRKAGKGLGRAGCGSLEEANQRLSSQKLWPVPASLPRRPIPPTPTKGMVLPSPFLSAPPPPWDWNSEALAHGQNDLGKAPGRLGELSAQLPEEPPHPPCAT